MNKDAENVRSESASAPMPPHDPEISIVLPCLNEQDSLAECLEQIKATIQKNDLRAEVIVVDNGSTDKSREIALNAQKNFPELLLLEEKTAGYGKAYMRGLTAARGRFIYMADCDGTYDFSEIPLFIQKLRDGADLVIGNRFDGQMEKEAMPRLHRHVGNPLLSLLVRLFFKVKIHDIHCGARAISKQGLAKITLYTTGMEFASEMIIKAARQHLKIVEVPVSYGVRGGTSKLRSFSDGWRHLRFILLYSPLVLFFLPGIIFLGLGLISMLLLYFTTPTIFGVQLFVHPLFLSCLFIITGYQLIIFSVFSKIYAITHLGETSPAFERLFKIITLEKAGLLGIVLTLPGALLYLFIFIGWVHSGFGSLDQIKNSIVALTFMVVGIQTFFSAFMLSMLGIKEK